MNRKEEITLNKFKRVGWVGAAVWLLLIVGCSEDSRDDARLLKAEWDDVLREAEGQTVNLYMWGGDASINRYMDEWAASRLQEETGVELNRVPMNDTQDGLNQLLAEKQAGKKVGGMDVIWLNGENFKQAKENDLLWGPFVEQLPNYQAYVDAEAPSIRKDFGEPTEGLEAPWGKAQFVFIYDTDSMSSPPRSIQAIQQWVKKHPGKFTYPAPPDFTGSAFIRHVLYEVTGGYEQYMKPLDEDAFAASLEPVWNYLNELEPYLWREGKTYPESLAKLDQLYSNGEVWMSMGYDSARAESQVQKGLFPSSTRTFVLEGGTLSNTHFLAIPFNAEHKAGAMAAINFLESPEAQLKKYDPDHWGENMAIDPGRLSTKKQEILERIDRGETVLPAEVLAEHRLPEIPAAYVDVLEEGWLKHVAQPE